MKIEEKRASQTQVASTRNAGLADAIQPSGPVWAWQSCLRRRCFLYVLLQHRNHGADVGVLQPVRPPTHAIKDRTPRREQVRLLRVPSFVVLSHHQANVSRRDHSREDCANSLRSDVALHQTYANEPKMPRTS